MCWLNGMPPLSAVSVSALAEAMRLLLFSRNLCVDYSGNWRGCQDLVDFCSRLPHEHAKITNSTVFAVGTTALGRRRPEGGHPHMRKDKQITY